MNSARTNHILRFFHLLMIIAFCIATSVTSPLRASEPTLFRAVDSTGVSDVLPFEEDDPRAYLYYTGHAGGAICLGDVNADGRPDVYFSRALRNNALYINQGDWKFEKTNGPFSMGDAWGTGAVLVDIDSDGDLDICQVNYDAPIQVFVNDGRGNFSEVPNAFGLAITDASMALSFADADNDGDLDAFLLCNTYFRPGGRPQDPPFELRNGKPVTKPGFEKYYRPTRERSSGKWTMDEYGRRDYFFLNEGTRTKPRYRDVSAESGLCDFGFGLSCVWWDYDGDGRIDLSVSNDFLSPDRLFRNMGVSNGVPRFRDVMGEVFPTCAWSSMGSGVADVNNDGLAELFTVDMAARSHFKSKLNMGEMAGERRWEMENGWPRQVMRNHLYVNVDNGHFREEAWMRGLASTDWSWAVKWGDYDEDGWNDVLVTNGMTRNFTDSDHHLVIGEMGSALVGKSQWDLFRDQPPMRETNVVFQNDRGFRFHERGKQWGLDLTGISYGAASGDLDGDGDLDLIVTDLGKPLKFYENQSNQRTNRLRVRLRGVTSNAMGIGAKVTVVDNQGVSRTRWMTPWMGFQSQDENVLHFGLGKQQAQRIEVVWPGRPAAQVVTVNGQAKMEISEAVAFGSSPPPQPRPWWQVAKLPWSHKETVYDDFAVQPLLPGKLSQPGPCLAAGDFDGDGDIDAYLGGAAGQAAGLLVNFDGQLKIGSADWGAGNESEDVAAIWFDADGDQDVDLYVVSGSVEFPAGDPRYRDRLYRNETRNGQFRLEGVPNALPDLRDSGSCVAAADYDRDGDLDLFVGSRSVVGAYPLTPPSRLLRNDSSGQHIRFEDVTKQVAVGMQKAGLVTDATWADLDGDQDPDLVLAVEWGPVRIFWNEDGVLQERAAVDMASRTGWWQAVATGDFDDDGDIDILTGNVGWNTKYGRPSPRKPAEIYYGDMDNTGTMRIIEAKSSNGNLLPVRGRSCSSHAIPGLAAKFSSYRQFALSDLTGIYGETCLSDAHHFSAVELASGMWENDGAGNFRWEVLPWEVQVSQVNDFAIDDVDQDGTIEVVVAQNEDAREPETGLWRGGLGVVMRRRSGSWQIVPTAETALLLKGAAQDIELVDVEGDGTKEILAGQNGGQLLLFRSSKQ